MSSGNISPAFTLLVVAIILLLVGVFIYYVVLHNPLQRSGKTLKSLLLGARRRKQVGIAQKGFTKILWGFLFIFLDFRINPASNNMAIDMILPDFVGYILIFIGLGSLSSLHQRFGRAKIFAAIMIFLSLANLAQFRRLVSPDSGITYWVRVLLPVLAIGVIIDLIMIWHICGGVIELAIASDKRRLARTAIIRRNLYLALAVIHWCSAILFFAVPTIFTNVSVWYGFPIIPSSPPLPLPFVVVRSSFAAIIIPLAIFVLVVVCLMMRLMKKVSLEIGENSSSYAENSLGGLKLTAKH